MRHNKTTKTPSGRIPINIKKELAKPRMAKSARVAEPNADATPMPEQPRITVTGTVDKIIPSPSPRHPEKAQIVVGKREAQYRDLRIENKLTDELGNDVKLKKGAHVAITVASKKFIPND
ncbi:MAG: hypothetical protein NVS9B13_15220 [Candidatus Acidiferrum sp.]